jgi:hypothetical protein
MLTSVLKTAPYNQDSVEVVNSQFADIYYSVSSNICGERYLSFDCIYCDVHAVSQQ